MHKRRSKRPKTDHPAGRKPVPEKYKKLFPGGRVLRPEDRVAINRVFGDEWYNYDGSFDWLNKCRGIAAWAGCGLIFDINKPWDESVYVENYNGEGRLIFAGGAGKEIDACSALLHEIGHRIIQIAGIEPADVIKREREAWIAAQAMAEYYELPFNPDCRRGALYLYRLSRLRDENKGSKRQSRLRRPKEPKTWKLTKSRRSGMTEKSTYRRWFAMGKKGKRYTKRELKRWAARADRRRPLKDD